MSPLKLLGVALITVAALQVSACKRSDIASDGPAPRDRFVGVGIYTPGAPWSQMVRTQPVGDAAAAKLVDDQAIIVVTDSVTGEIRACGDMSGYCVGMNPWRTALTKEQLSPVKLAAHQKGAEVTGPAANATDDGAPDGAKPKP